MVQLAKKVGVRIELEDKSDNKPEDVDMVGTDPGLKWQRKDWETEVSKFETAKKALNPEAHADLLSQISQQQGLLKQRLEEGKPLAARVAAAKESTTLQEKDLQEVNSYIDALTLIKTKHEQQLQQNKELLTRLEQ